MEWEMIHLRKVETCENVSTRKGTARVSRLSAMNHPHHENAYLTRQFAQLSRVFGSIPTRRCRRIRYHNKIQTVMGETQQNFKKRNAGYPCRGAGHGIRTNKKLCFAETIRNRLL